MQTTITRQISSLLTRYGFPYEGVSLNPVSLSRDTFDGNFIGEVGKPVYFSGKYRFEEKCGVKTYTVVSMTVNNENLPIGRR